MINSKRFSRFQKNHTAPAGMNSMPVEYSIVIKKHRQHLFLRTYSGDIRMFYEIFLDKIYRLPDGLLPANPVIVDAGANIGITASYFSFSYPSAKIFCIEPSASNYLLLTKNLQKQIASGRVVPLEAALYYEDVFVRLDESGWAYNAHVNTNGKTIVAGITVTSFMHVNKIEKIDLLKMDIEGAEAEIFAGNLSWLTRVNNILIEIHTAALVETIQSILKGQGFYWYDHFPGNDGGSVYLASRQAVQTT